MENLWNIVLGLLEPLPREWFTYVPWAFAIALMVLVALKHRNIRAPLLAGAVTYTATSCLLFLYILLQPLRTSGSRWLEGATVIEPPKVSKVPEAPDLSGVPLAGDDISGFLNGFSSSTNETIASLNQTSATVVAQINLVNAYKHTLGVANEFLVYSFWGFVAVLVALIFWWFARWVEKRHVKAEELQREEEKEAAREAEIAELRNLVAYSKGMVHFLAAGKLYEYDSDYDYEKNSYYQYHVEAEEAEQTQQAIERQRSAAQHMSRT